MERIGQYVVRKVLGEGHFGTVYLAEGDIPGKGPRSARHKLVAIKQLRGEWTMRGFETLVREFELLDRVKHRSLCRVYEFLDRDNAVVMEYVEGATLRQVLDAFARDATKRAALGELGPYLRQIHGALKVLGFERAADILPICEQLIASCARPEHDDLDGHDMDWIAEGLSSVGFFLDPCLQGREPAAEAVELFFRRYDKAHAPAEARAFDSTVVLPSAALRGEGEAAPAEGSGGPPAAGRHDQPVARAHDIRRIWLVRRDGEGPRSAKERRINPLRIDEQGGQAFAIRTGEGDRGLQMQAAAQLYRDDRIAERHHNIFQRPCARGIGTARLAHIKPVADPQHVSTVECPAGNFMNVKIGPQPFRGRWRLARPGYRSGTRDDGVGPEQQSRILDENGIGVVGQIGQADNIESRLLQRLLIGFVLRSGERRVDRLAIQMGKCAFYDAWARGAGEGQGHGAVVADKGQKKRAAPKGTALP